MMFLWKPVSATEQKNLNGNCDYLTILIILEIKSEVRDMITFFIIQWRKWASIWFKIHPFVRVNVVLIRERDI